MAEINLGFGTPCPRCGESHLLAVLRVRIDSPFNGEDEQWVMCSRCMDEFVTGKDERIPKDQAVEDRTLYDWVQGHL